MDLAHVDDDDDDGGGCDNNGTLNSTEGSKIHSSSKVSFLFSSLSRPAIFIIIVCFEY